ncbi:MAG TPA: HEPN domain-containing protein [Salinivirgaceae bacterium]|nr:HEPN domain-containing protein [Salinivirgaceae bacterium]
MTDYKPEDYISYRIERAKETIGEVKIHIENKFWNTAINRMYYACFYAVGALLTKHNIEASSHAGVRQKFGQVFVKSGKFDRKLAKHYTDLFEKRHKGDYNVFFEYDEETVLRLYPLSIEFIKQIEKLLEE